MVAQPNESTSNVQAEISVSPPDVITGTDGLPMLLVGKDSTPGQSDQTRLFYVDKTRITNHHFAEFLNEVRAQLTVEKGVVKHKEDIWLYLGNGQESFEQIVFAHKKFHLKDPKRGGEPIVRVTFFGARAYARHFGKQLLTEAQWLAAFKTYPNDIVAVPKTHVASGSSNKQHPHMMSTSDGPSNQEPPREDIHETGATQMGILSSEWIKAEDVVGTGAPASRVILRYALNDETKSEIRYPWEAFKDVGFRTAVEISDVSLENTGAGVVISDS